MSDIIKDSFLRKKIGFASVASVLTIICQIIYSLGLEDLATLKYPTSISLIYVFGIFLILVVSFAVFENKTVAPQNMKPQLARFIMIGLATWLFTESYTYLPASSVSMIQRSEIPMIIVAGYLMGQIAWSKQVKFAWFVVFAYCCFIIYTAIYLDDFLGIILAQSGVLITIITFQLMQKSINKEGEYASFAVTAVSCIFYGFLFSALNHQWVFIKTEHLYLVMAVAISLFLSYKAMASLYRTKTLAYARFPALIGSVMVLFGEQIHEKDIFSWDFDLFIISLSFLIYWLLFRIKVSKITIE
jgi:hypothetical protein